MYTSDDHPAVKRPHGLHADDLEIDARGRQV